MKVLHIRNICGMAVNYAYELEKFGIYSEVWNFDTPNAFRIFSSLNKEYQLYIPRNKLPYSRTINFLRWLFRKAKDFDIIHLHDITLSEYLFLKLLRKKIIIGYYGSTLRVGSLRTTLINKIEKNIIVGGNELARFVPHPVFLLLISVNMDVFYPQVSTLYDEFHDGYDHAILHCPTNPVMKGTNFLEEAINKLINEGYSINYIRKGLDDPIPHEMMQQYINGVDVVVDQLLTGDYGSFAREAMACGKPVIVYLNPEFFKDREMPPVCNANPKTIYKKLKYLLDNPKDRDIIGKGLHDYVKKYHNSIEITKNLIMIYQQVLGWTDFSDVH